MAEDVAETSAPSREADELQRAILRGEVTVQDAISSGRLTPEQIGEWQGRFLVRTEARPWERVLVRAWNFGTRGRLSWFTIPMFFIFVVIPALASLYESGAKLVAAAEAYFRPGASEMAASELDVCNEWVARISRHPSQEDALRAKDELITTMKNYDKWVWVEDVHIVRDVAMAVHFLLVIDMCSGPASAAVIGNELQALTPSGSSALGNLLQAAKPLYYSESSFEKAYGRISPDSIRCGYEEVPSGSTGIEVCS